MTTKSDEIIYWLVRYLSIQGNPIKAVISEHIAAFLFKKLSQLAWSTKQGKNVTDKNSQTFLQII